MGSVPRINCLLTTNYNKVTKGVSILTFFFYSYLLTALSLQGLLRPEPLKNAPESRDREVTLYLIKNRFCFIFSSNTEGNLWGGWCLYLPYTLVILICIALS